MDFRRKRRLVTLKKRDEFLKLRAAKPIHTQGFILQANHRDVSDQDQARFGFTVTKKVGNAVVRNRIRRRLREIVRCSLPKTDELYGDFVLIGKLAALHENFDVLVCDLLKALNQKQRARTSQPAINARA